MREFNAYVGLRNSAGSEPNSDSGYKRVHLGKILYLTNPLSLFNIPAEFPQVQAPGYGIISEVAIYDRAEGGEPLWLFTQPEALDFHEDTIPIIQNGKLYRGVDVSAAVVVSLQDNCSGTSRKE